MAKCIECEYFDGANCTRIGFVAKCPTIHLPCKGYKHTTKNNCLENYSDFCEHRVIIDAPFSADWCNLKRNYCNNNKLIIEET